MLLAFPVGGLNRNERSFAIRFRENAIHIETQFDVALIICSLHAVTIPVNVQFLRKLISNSGLLLGCVMRR